MKIVTAAIVQDNGRYLIARRRLGEKLAGMWEFPGGKVEFGESLPECLKRELMEELGVKADVGEVLAESQGVGVSEVQRSGAPHVPGGEEYVRRACVVVDEWALLQEDGESCLSAEVCNGIP